MTTPFFLRGAALAACFPALLGAAEVQLKAERVALFNNGYSQVSLTGELPDARMLELKGLPVPVEGTLWWQLPQGASPVQVEGSIREREIPDPHRRTEDLLAANVGRKVSITMSSGQVYEGELIRRPLPELGTLTYTNHKGSAQQQRLSQQAPVFLRNAQGDVLEINLGTVLSLSFDVPPATPMIRELQPQLSMELREAAPGGTLHLECLAGGLSWTPSYRVDLQEQGSAELKCMAVITNNMIDLEQVQLELITGHPTLGRDGLPPSPLARLNSIPETENDLYRVKRKSVQAVAMVNMEDAFADDDAAEESEPRVTRTLELYHYPIANFSARKDSTVAREIFTQTSSCAHVYTCHFGVKQTKASVYHCLRLSNGAAWPWSPGSVVCYSGGNLLARTTLGATAAGQEALLTLAATLDATATCREEQVSQGSSFGITSRNKSGREAEPSTYRGVITLKNDAEQPMDIELSKKISGTATEASDGGQIHTSPEVRGNATSRITWKYRLEPGQEKTCTYSYTHFD